MMNRMLNVPIKAATASGDSYVKQWTPVNERAPRVGRVVMITDRSKVGFATLTFRDNSYVWTYLDEQLVDNKVTHWRDIPNPPKENAPCERKGVDTKK